MNTVLLALAATGVLAAQEPITTTRYDRFGAGANTHETILNNSNVNAERFGKLYSYPVDGSVYAQPLYVPSVRMQGGETRNVLYVATMNDQVYAFDADRNAPALWKRDLTGGLADITPVPVADITHNNNLNIVGNVGVLSTPVIDVGSHAIYLVARTKEKGAYVQRLYALDIRSGTDKTAPVTIEAEVPGSAKDAVNGVLRFNPKTANQRPALALVKKRVLIAWASHEDIGPYHGWIMAYDAKSLKQVGVFCDTPDGNDGGIWQSGRGPAVDADGYIYYQTGNGDWDGKRQFGETLLKLRLEKKGFSIADYYTPPDWQILNKRDADFGSTGPMLLPKTNLIVCGDKKGFLYLLNTRDLGKVDAKDTQLLQSLSVKGGRVLNGPAYWDGPQGPSIYLWGEADFLKAFRFDGKQIGPEAFAKGSAASRGSPGGALTVSANGSRAGTGIVWALLTINRSADHGNAPGILYAYDAETLKELWSSEGNAERDKLGTLVKFVPPVVAAGKVYAVTYDNVLQVYGLFGR